MRSFHSIVNENQQINWQILKSLIPYLSEFKIRITLALFCMIVAKLANVALPFILKYTVDFLDIVDETSVLVALPLGLLLAYGVARFSTVIFGEIRDTLFGRVTERAMRRIGLKVFRHLHALDLRFHLNRQTGGLSRNIERGTSGIGFLLRFMVFNIVPTLLEIIMVIILLLVNYDIWFALITFIAVFVYVIYSIKATTWRTRYVKLSNEADSNTNTRAIDSLLNYETVKYFTNEDYEAERYDEELAKWEQARRKNRLSVFALNGGQALIISAALTAMMILAASNIIQGTMTLGDFVLVNAFMMQIFMPLNFLGFVYREMKGSMANIEQMFDLLKQQPAVMDKQDAAQLQVSQGQIEFRNVHFAYSDNRNILQGISFTVDPGEKVAVVGSSGAGKSTIVKLLFRFYDCNQGGIFIDGQDIKLVTQQSLRQVIGIVPQDTVLFNSSIYDNICYGRIYASEADIQHAIKMAHLDDFIRQLPNGSGTIVGERGLKLSGGEKQRVAIARTILKQPSILVFDEATSSLDSQSEQLILQAINEITRGQTSLVIAHRLSTIVDADNIIVLDNGLIVEQGTHYSLLSQKGIYARLWEIQQQERGNNKDSTSSEE